MPERPPPVVQALLLADYLHKDPRSNKYNIYGVFNGVTCPYFPVVLPDPWVYLALTELHGPTTVQVRIVGADEVAAHFAVDLTANADSPLIVVETGFPIRGTRFTGPGLYRLQVVSAGLVIAERRFQLVFAGDRVPEPGGMGKPRS
ncbi:MAG: hypothetical protein JWO38_3944 [Gemmataceae bacterium]|nr:hypothetical protein [Gemmataceae bacterium]